MIYTNKDLGDLMEQAENNQPFTFKEFLDLLYGYKEVIFYYQGLKYGADLGYHPGEDFQTVDFFVCDTDDDQYTTFNSLEDFAANAKINGKLLKDIWSKVTNVNYD
ncbi:MAG: hypothetical protein NC133_00655 [Prevotella sp.]|nr:hypothetical protein [Prevotella sp.]